MKGGRRLSLRAQWYRYIGPELSRSCFGVFADNQGAITCAENSLSCARSKHVDVRFLFVRELLRAKKIDIQFVASEEQPVDILTNPLLRPLLNLTVGFC